MHQSESEANVFKSASEYKVLPHYVLVLVYTGLSYIKKLAYDVSAFDCLIATLYNI